MEGLPNVSIVLMKDHVDEEETMHQTTISFNHQQKFHGEQGHEREGMSMEAHSRKKIDV